VTTLRRFWLACLILGAIIACVRLLSDWRPTHADRRDQDVERTIVLRPPDYSAEAVSPQVRQWMRRQSEVANELSSLSGSSPQVMIPGMAGAGGVGGRIVTADPVVREARIKQLNAEATQLSSKIAAERLAECRQRMTRRGVVLGGASCTDLDEIVRNLATGTYSFNRPRTATLGEEFVLRLILQTKPGQPANFEGVVGPIQRVENKPFAQSIEATLSGQDFDISPNTAQARTATSERAVEWNWKLTPTSTGTKTITIEVAANILMSPEKQRVQIDTLRETIEIQVTVFQRVKSYLADASGAIIAIAALVAPLAAIFGFFPTARQFVVTELSRFRRRRSDET